MKFFSMNGYSFYTYRFIISLISLITLLVFIYKLDANYNVVISMYLVTQFFLDGIQLRNFFALPFFLVAIYFLLMQKRRWRLWYILFVVFSGLIHISYFTYLVFLLLPSLKKNHFKVLKIHVLIGIIFCIVLLFERKNIFILLNLLYRFDPSRAASYSINATNYGPLIIIALHFMNIFVSYILYREMNKIDAINNETRLSGRYKKNMYIIKGIFVLNILGLYLVPFSFIQLTFYRLVRNLLIINFSGFGILSNYYRKNWKLICLSVFYIGVWILAEFFILNEFNVLVEPFFTNNHLINYSPLL